MIFPRWYHCLTSFTVRNVFHQRQRSLYMATNTNILTLRERGLIQNVFPEEKLPKLTNALIGSPQTIYCGFDPTADSLHIGNLLSLITLLHGHRAGHQIIAVVGGATAQIGDPSGRTTERQQIDPEQLRVNASSLQENINRIFRNYGELFHEGKKELLPPLILNNADWYSDVTAVEFLCNAGRYFRMGSMLSRQSVQIRLKSPEGMSLTEFMYQVFQAYDWLHLHRKHNCTIQIGGSDQLGNMVSGYELIHHVTGKSVFGLTTPLVTNTAGNKLGKSAGNAVWLDPRRTSPFDLYQFFVRLPDSDVERYLKLFTFLPDNELSHIISRHKETPEKRIAQTRLAQEVTRLVHDEDGLESAVRCTIALYGDTPEHLAKLSHAELANIFSNAATAELFLDPGTTVFDVVMRAKCFGRTEDADRVIRAGGVYVNHQRVVEPEQVLIPGEHILPNNLSVVRVGKKNYYLIRWIGSS